ncbi:MAG: ABC transporter permease [Cypionkella sp.]|nr:ABC transporter permease [Cypionkella sp.]
MSVETQDKGGAGTSASGTATASSKARLPADVAILVFLRDRGIFVLWAILLILFSIWNHPYFASVPNAILIVAAASLTAIFAASVAIGLLSGALDLSVPGVAALCSCLAGAMIEKWGFSVPVSLIAALAFGGLCGLINGRIVLSGLNPLVVTIGTLSVTGGLAAVVAGGYAISGLSELQFMGSARYFGLPSHAYIVAIVYSGMTIFLSFTRTGIRLRAVGGNAEAVRRAGISANRYQLYGFILSAMLAALGGLMSTALVTQATPTANPAVLFTALTAVFLAGVSLRGGRGSLPRVLIGALILATISNALTIAGVQPYWATITTGVLMIAALAFDKYLTEAISARLVKISNATVHGSVKQ